MTTGRIRYFLVFRTCFSAHIQPFTKNNIYHSFPVPPISKFKEPAVQVQPEISSSFFF